MADTEPAARRSDHSPWNWLLLLPIVVPLLTFLYNKETPRLGGFPFFYWAQFAFIVLGVVCTTVVYLTTRRPDAATPEDTSAPSAPQED